MSISARRERVAPRASVLIESMRDIGYSLPTAVADLIDNSLAATATRIEILTDTESTNPAIGILDNGQGMSASELLEAMRPGTRSPLAQRAATDLGRFGLGLKTASFSQCRRLTVVTRRRGDTCSAIWDLDMVAETEDWYIEIPDHTPRVPWIDRLESTGTLVLWQKLDRVIGLGSSDTQEVTRQIDRTASHLELVFHRFLRGTGGRRAVKILMNGRELEPLDPFHLRHPATQIGQRETFSLDGRKIHIMAVTLPHHSKVTVAEWDRHAGPGGHLRNQGFYLYRNRRLIVHGTWFGLASQAELTRLTRVRIDIPNELDALWKVDVKKASAQPPAPVRNRLRKIIEQLGSPSKRVYTQRGHVLSTDNRLPVWVRTQKSNEIHYRLNTEHPILAGFQKRLTPDAAREFRVLTALIDSTLPIDAIFADAGSNPKNLSPVPLQDERFVESVKSTWRALTEAGVSQADATLMMSHADPFRSNWDAATKVLNEMASQEPPNE